VKTGKFSQPQKEKNTTLNIQAKLFVFLGFILFILIAIASYSAYGISQITNSSTSVINQDIALIRLTQNSLISMFEAKSALENALLINDYARVDQIREKEALLDKNITLFDLYLNALTWGSGSKAFSQSEGGINLEEWKRLNLGDSLTTQSPPYQQAQIAGSVDIYFGGFANNALRAIVWHKKFLRLQSEHAVDEKTIQQANSASKEYAANALRFSSLTISNLAEIVKLSNASIILSSQETVNAQGAIQRTIFFIFGLGLFLSFLVSFLFTRRYLIHPLQALTQAAQKISEGDLTSRVYIKTKDEIGLLAKVFNEMASNLHDYTVNLEKKVEDRTKEITEINKHLEELNQELNTAGKILVGRDLELTQANARLQELDAIKSEFVSIAAHQLRTPLTGIRWSYHTLLEKETGELNPEQKKIIDDALKATISLVALINDLLSIARIEEGKFGFNLKRQPILPIIETSLKKYQAKAKEKGVTLTTQITSSTLPEVNVDEEKLGIVFDNFFDNAVKYTPPGGEITLNISAKEENLYITIHDTGIGIPQGQAHRLFSKFFRAENAVRFQTSGTGLGLYVAKNIIQKHNGNISVQSNEGKGSAFTISLPIL